jgi:hypothetical protein
MNGQIQSGEGGRETEWKYVPFGYSLFIKWNVKSANSLFLLCVWFVKTKRWFFFVLKVHELFYIKQDWLIPASWTAPQSKNWRENMPNHIMCGGGGVRIK